MKKIEKKARPIWKSTFSRKVVLTGTPPETAQKIDFCERNVAGILPPPDFAPRVWMVFRVQSP